MKRLAVFALAAHSVFAADFVTGQAARAVIGQRFFTEAYYWDPTSTDPRDPDPKDGVHTLDKVLGGVSGLAYANGALYVADSNRVSALPINHRIMVYRDIAAQIPAPAAAIPQNGDRCPLCFFKADLVLGWPGFGPYPPMQVKVDDTHTYTVPGDPNSIDPKTGKPTSALYDASSGFPLYATSKNRVREPTGIATDGVRLVVADTDNNRVLIWNTIPQTSGKDADLVLGQKDFDSFMPNVGTGDARIPGPSTLRGPQGVWIQNNMLFVADTQNHRVLIWRTFPTTNFQPADQVLGQPNLTTATEADPLKQESDPTPTSLLNPVSVTSDGVRLFVSDLGHNRVLIWNTIPAQNTAAADIALGQPDLNSGIANNSYKIISADQTTGVIVREKVLCESDGTDDHDQATYPARCGKTLSFPRYALSDGTRLFVADGGNDRVLIYKTMPAASGAKADIVLGQFSDTLNQTSDNSGNPDSSRRNAADAMRTPSGLAWDGTNLYVGDPFGRRVLVYTPGDGTALTPVRNAASMEVYAIGTVSLSGAVNEKDSITLTVDGRDYKYTAKKNDTLAIASIGLANLINAGKGDAEVFATALPVGNQVRLTSKLPGTLGNNIKLTTAASNSSGLQIAAGTISGGGDAAKIGYGALITIFGQNFTTETVSATQQDLHPGLPTKMGGVQVYVDGRLIPLLFVSPKQINAQLPFEVLDATSSNLYVRTTRSDGSVTVSQAVGVPQIPSNPGIFAVGGKDPRPGVIVHSSSEALGSVLLSGTATAGDVTTIKIEDRLHSYTVRDGDTLDTIRDALIALINANDPKVRAAAASQFDRIQLRARQSGGAGNGIAYSATVTGGHVILSASSSALCCANVAGALVTKSNPAVPGETITAYGTGLGMINDPARFRLHTGIPYLGPAANHPDESVSSLAGGKTANVINAAMQQYGVGVYRVDLELNTDLPTDDQTPLTIAQNVYVSNVVTFPVKGPPPTVTSISPTSGARGATLSVTIIGTGFASGATCSFGAGITVNSCTFSSSTALVASLTIASDAATGTRTVTVANTTSGSGSKADAFTVNAS